MLPLLDSSLVQDSNIAITQSCSVTSWFKAHTTIVWGFDSQYNVKEQLTSAILFEEVFLSSAEIERIHETRWPREGQRNRKSHNTTAKVTTQVNPQTRCAVILRTDFVSGGRYFLGSLLSHKVRSVSRTITGIRQVCRKNELCFQIPIWKETIYSKAKDYIK